MKLALTLIFLINSSLVSANVDMLVAAIWEYKPNVFNSILKSKNFDPNQLSTHGEAPLVVAATVRDPEMVEKLLKMKADVNILSRACPDRYKTMFKGGYGYQSDKKHKKCLDGKHTPFSAAAQLEIFREKDKNDFLKVNMENYEKVATLLINAKKFDANTSSEKFGPPLFSACAVHEYVVLKLLIKKEAQLSVKARYGNGPIRTVQKTCEDYYFKKNKKTHKKIMGLF